MLSKKTDAFGCRFFFVCKLVYESAGIMKKNFLAIVFILSGLPVALAQNVIEDAGVGMSMQELELL